MNSPSSRDSLSWLNDTQLRKGFGLAVANDPHMLYDHYVRSLQEQQQDLSMAISDHLLPFLENSLQSDYNAFNVCNLIREGISDSQSIWEGALDDAGDVTKSEALEIIKHPISTYVVAKLVGFDFKTLNKIVTSPDRKNIYHINDDHRRLVIGRLLPQYNANTGCPYGGHANGQHEPSEADKLFLRTVPWAGTLAVLHYFDRAIDPVTETSDHHNAA